MRVISNFQLAIVAAILGAFGSVLLTGAGAQGQSVPIQTIESGEKAIFAGGCFWCVESDFDKVPGVLDTISGYSGGTTMDPTYASHSEDGHLEVVEVTYDPDVVTYEELVAFFFRHVDPIDTGGQFCDRGNSYTTAVFALDDAQAEVARNEIARIDASQVLPRRVVTPVRRATAFHPAEDYHQDYYLKQPLKYAFYRRACGRDARVQELWGSEVSG